MKAKSSGLIVGISIGVVIGALLAIIGLLCFRFHRKRLQIGNSSYRRAATFPIQANGADSCTVLLDSSMGTESSRTSVHNGVSSWFGGPRKSHVVAALGILDAELFFFFFEVFDFWGFLMQIAVNVEVDVEVDVEVEGGGGGGGWWWWRWRVVVKGGGGDRGYIYIVKIIIF
ncbi:hypothetical protein HanPI659440_Chr07g0256451 [Helianthus annuus]|nr:hypothetical protein HanPI659440_Chr07g0256451 [Helianthus annuus]